MAILKDSIAAKLSVALVAVAMALTLVAPAAQAVTVEELQSQIADLMATINSLQSGAGQSDSMSGGSCDSISAPLTMGAQNANVTALQNFLIGAGQSIPAGATGYFGGQTQAALAGWQAANGVAPAVGYYGPITKAAMDAQCVPADDNMDDSDDSDDNMDDSDDSDDSLEGGEADVNSYDFSDEEDEIEEGEEDVALLNVEFDVEDGDVRLERMDVTLDATALIGAGKTGEAEPWDAFEEISIWVDGDKVASKDVTDEDDWDDNAGDEFVFRITNIDTVFREDTTGEVVVALSAQSGVDVDGDAGEDDWDIFMDSDSLRFVDSEDLDIKGPTSDATASDKSTFEMVESGDGDDLNLESADADPDASTLEIDEDKEKEHLIFAFDLSTDDSDGDVTLDNLISVNVTVGGTDGTSLDNFIDDFRLEIDGDSYDAESYIGSGTGVTIDFDIDGDTEIKEDETVVVKLFANFDDAGNSFSDATVQASTTAAQIDSEGSNSGENIIADGSQKNGKVHTVRTEGLAISAEPTDGTGSGDAVEVVSGVATDDNYGTMFLEFDVTAFGEDAWVPVSNAVRGASTTAGLAYTIEIGGSATTAGAVSVSYDIESADEDNGFFELVEGVTYTMRVDVDSYNPTVSGTFNLQVLSISFSNVEDTIDTDNEAPADLSDYESDEVQINS